MVSAMMTVFSALRDRSGSSTIVRSAKLQEDRILRPEVQISLARLQAKTCTLCLSICGLVFAAQGSYHIDLVGDATDEVFTPQYERLANQLLCITED